jgi:hypothetical protein
VCVPRGIVSGLMGVAISVRERSGEVPSVDMGVAAKRRRVACSSSPVIAVGRDWTHEHCQLLARHPREAKGSARQSP